MRLSCLCCAAATLSVRASCLTCAGERSKKNRSPRSPATATLRFERQALTRPLAAMPITPSPIRFPIRRGQKIQLCLLNRTFERNEVKNMTMLRRKAIGIAADLNARLNTCALHNHIRHCQAQFRKGMERGASAILEKARSPWSQRQTFGEYCFDTSEAVSSLASLSREGQRRSVCLGRRNF
jgi:hypothetical protein